MEKLYRLEILNKPGVVFMTKYYKLKKNRDQAAHKWSRNYKVIRSSADISWIINS